MIKKCLIVGYGGIAQRHIAVIRSFLPNVIVAVYRDSALTIEDDNVNLTLVSLAEISKFQPDIAIIASPAPFHMPMAKFLAGLGVHLLIEKPISIKSSEAKDFYNYIFDKNIVVKVGYNLRFLPSLKFFRMKILEGLIGDVWSVSSEVAQHLETWRPGKDYRKTVSAKKSLGGGVLLELSHEIDYLIWIFGFCTWVSAWVGKSSDLEIDVEDSARLIMGFNGAPGKEIPIGLNMNFFRKDKVRLCTAVGSKGTLIWDGVADSVRLLSSQEPAMTYLFSGNGDMHQTYLDQCHVFLKAISEADYVKTSLNDAIDVINIIEGSKISSEIRNSSKFFMGDE